jgi:hypothetical protein
VRIKICRHLTPRLFQPFARHTAGATRCNMQFGIAFLAQSHLAIDQQV